MFPVVLGGDHCFVSVINQEEKISPFDCRDIDPKTQILTISLEFVKNLLNISCNSPVDQDILSFLETYFKSLSCLNGSFLLANDMHYYCTSKHHGVDMDLAEEIFTLIGRIENQSIKDLVSFNFYIFNILVWDRIENTESLFALKFKNFFFFFRILYTTINIVHLQNISDNFVHKIVLYVELLLIKRTFKKFK